MANCLQTRLWEAKVWSWPRSILLAVSSIRWPTISSATTIGLTFFSWKLTPPLIARCGSKSLGGWTHGKFNSPAEKQTGSDRDRHQIVSRGPNEVLNHLSIGSARKFDGSNHVTRIATHEDDPGGLYGNIRTRANSDSDIRGDECGRVIDTVSNHRNTPATCLKPLDGGRFVGRKDLGGDLIDAEASSNGLRDRPRITCDHCDAHSQLVQFFHRFFRFRSNFVFHRKGADYTIL